jgi:hypothetical protein
MVGKWHLGSRPTGFYRWIILPGQGNPQLQTPAGTLTLTGHTTGLTGQLGIECMKTRPKDQPFFLMLHHKAPHRNWAGIKAGLRPEAFLANFELAPTFLDLAGVPVPNAMQGRSLKPLLAHTAPSEWRQSVFYRYYHDPGHHNTRAHYGIRTTTHKLIHYWKKDGWDLFDLVADPHEQNNLLFPDPASGPEPVRRLFAKLRTQLKDLQSTYHDNGKYAAPAACPRGGVGGISGLKSIGHKTVAQGIALSQPKKAIKRLLAAESFPAGNRLLLRSAADELVVWRFDAAWQFTAAEPGVASDSLAGSLLSRMFGL